MKISEQVKKQLEQLKQDLSSAVMPEIKWDKKPQENKPKEKPPMELSIGPL